MKIAIDTRWANIRSGVGNYIAELVNELAKIDKENEYILFGVDVGVRQDNFKLVKLEGPKRKFFQGLWKTVRWPNLEAIIGDVDLVHFTNYTDIPLKNKNTKKIITVHDLAWVHFPETIEEKNLWFLRNYCESSMKDADTVLTVSKFCKQDIEDNFPYLEGKVEFVHNGVSDMFCKLEDNDYVDSVKKKYGLDKPYTMFVGTLEPRKNLHLLIKAFSISEMSKDRQLLLVGAKGWKQGDLGKQVKRLKMEDRIVQPGFISNEDLVALYNGAEVYVMPSKFEGFGIPLIEAMCCGVPVIAADNSSMPEVVGSAGMLFDNYDVRSLSTALEGVWSDEMLRETLLNNAKVHCKTFSWKKMAGEVLEIYKKNLDS